MIDLKKLNVLKNLHFGVIHPDGSLEPVSMYEHLSVFKKKFPEEFQRLKDDLDQAFCEHESSIPEGEHPEWHIYEMYESNRLYDFRQRIMNLAYQDGFVRIGIFYNKDNEKTLEAEGEEKSVTSFRKIYKEIVEMLDLKGGYIETYK